MKIRNFFYGLLLPLSFAPFHLPIFAILSLALFYRELRKSKPAAAFIAGLLYGLGFFGFGVSWIFVSIHEYSNLSAIVSGCITVIFILYFALFPACVAVLYTCVRIQNQLLSILGFASIWIVSEYLRSTLFTGFPWLLIGFGQFDTVLRTLLPIIGV